MPATSVSANAAAERAAGQGASASSSAANQETADRPADGAAQSPAARASAAPRPGKPPGPRGGPLGNLKLIRDPLPYLMKTFAEYGDVVHYRLFNIHIYLVEHPEGVQRVLQGNHRNYTKGTFDYKLLKRLLGEGLLTSDGALWLRQRRLIQPVFHRQRVAAFGELMTGLTLEMLDTWRTAAADGRPFDIAREMMRLTLRIVARALLSVDISSESDTIARALTVLNEGFGEYNLITTLAPFLPTRNNREQKASARELDRIISEIVAARRREGVDRGDLLSMMLQARDEETGAGMDDGQLRDELLTLILAGHETTANALAWTWYLLSENPEAERKLDAELRQVLNGRPPRVADLPNLKYTRMVLDEAMRLYPPAWSVARMPTEDDEIGGYRIPAGSTVMLSQYVTQRDPRFWDSPERFEPERFEPERVEARPRFSYFPFGGGPRLCIGNTFALTEGALIIATIARRYRLRLVKGHPIALQPLVTLRPRHGIKVALEAKAQ